MDNKAINCINILDAIVTCDYLINNRDLIISIFYDTFMTSKCNIFLTFKCNATSSNYEKILVVRWYIAIKLNTKLYEVPILIYFPKMFPGVAPEIFVEKVDEIGVNQKSYVIDQKSLRINVASLKNWNMLTSSLQSVFNEIVADFSNFFPVYKLDVRDHGKFNYGEDCILNKENIQVVSFEAKSQLDIENGGFSNFTNPNSNSNLTHNKEPLISLNDFYHKKGEGSNIITNNKTNINIYVPQIKPKPITFSEEQIKQIYITDMIGNIFPKLKIEKLKLKSQEEKLSLYKTEFLTKIEDVKTLASRKDEIIFKISSLSSGVADKVKTLKSYIKDNSNVAFSFENIDKIIKISDPVLVNTIAAEVVLEDILAIIKKAFERKIFEMEETVKMTRKFSRELYTIKFYKENLIKVILNNINNNLKK